MTSLVACRAHPDAAVLFLYVDGDTAVFECAQCDPPALIRVSLSAVRVTSFEPRILREGVEDAGDDAVETFGVGSHGHKSGGEDHA